MKTKFPLLLLCAFAPLFLFAQKFALRGALVDSSGAALEGGTVMLLSPRDTSLLAFTRSQAGGAFEFRSVAAGDYLLCATYVGYRTLEQSVQLSGDARAVDLGRLTLESPFNLLGQVEITAQANPVAIRGDTIDFNANSFRTRPNAVVEDLLRKLPGVEVDADGTVRAMGREVTNILVDGKKFFGNDPKLATRNLPADAVNRVQVYDQKSQQAQFSGVDDGQREKTINLQLKDDRKRGWFGNVRAGGGHGADAVRYESRLSLNRFSPRQQLSFLGLGNNINQPGFSVEDYLAFSGAMRQMMSGGGGRVSLEFDPDNMSVPIDFGNNEGFLRTWAGGANFNQEYGKKYRSDLNASYMYSQADRRYDRTTQRRSFLPNGEFSTSGTSSDNNILDNHRLNLTLDQKVDSFNSVLLTSAFAYGDNRAQSRSNTQTFDAEGNLQNEGNRLSETDRTGANWTGSLLWRHKFARKGRNFSVNVDAGLNRSESSGRSFSDNGFFRDSGPAMLRDTVAQNQLFQNDVTNFGARATFTEPLRKRRYLEFSYAWALTDSRADKDVFDVASGENTFNDALSNAYTSRFSYQRAGAGFRINRKQWNGSLGFDLQAAVLDGEVTSGQGQPVRQTFHHALPRLDFNYEFSPTRNFRLNYQTRVTAPTVQQLQPVPDLSDPLNIQEGNPGLRPEYAHAVQANYVSFNPGNMRSFFTNVGFDYVADNIVYAQNIDSQFVRRYRPVNTPSNYQLFAMAAWGMPVKKLKSRLNFRSEGRWNRGQGLVNEVVNFTTGLALTEALSWDYEPAEWFTLSAGAELTWNQSHYSIDAAFDQEFFTQNYTAQLDLELPKDFAFNSALDLAVNTGRADGYNQAIPIWNAEVTKLLFKNKRLQVGLGVRDLLNRNLGLHRSTDLNYVEDQRVASLGRTVMVRATYSLTNMGGPGGGGPRMRMMIRR